MPKKPTKAGKYTLVVSDKSSIHNFHLKGPGVNVATSVATTGTKTFTITLKKGKYTFVCDPHATVDEGVLHHQVGRPVAPTRQRAPAARSESLEIRQPASSSVRTV